MNGDRQTGRVCWFDDARGYGFITPDAGNEEVFVHHTEIRGQSGRRTLHQDEAVTFETASTPKGLRAIDVYQQ